MRKLHAEGMGVRKIGSLLSRSSDTVSKHVFKQHIKKTPIPKGRPQVITPALFKKMEKEYQKLLKKSQPHEVTIAMLKERMGLTCSDKTVSRAFWQRGIHFKPLYEKPVLTEGDKAERLAWAQKNKRGTPQQWNPYRACQGAELTRYSSKKQNP